MELPKSPKIALLIDADNAPADLVDEILTELSTVGVINIRRAYGNWTKSALSGWQARLLEFAIRPMQQFDYSRRKNATDMAMTVDAMELLYTEHPDAFGIVSSDADFTPLVLHLRAKGAMVIGFGAAQTPQPFVNACSRFLYLEALRDGSEVAGPNGGTPGLLAVNGAAVAEGDGVQTKGQRGASGAGAATAAAAGVAPPALVARTAPREEADGTTPAQPGQRVPTNALRQDTRLMNRLRNAVRACEDEQGWARVGQVGSHIANIESFDARNYGYGSLTKLLAATQAFDMRDEGSSRVAVRLKAAAPAR